MWNTSKCKYTQVSAGNMNIYHVYIQKELGIIFTIFGPVRLEEADIRAYGIVKFLWRKLFEILLLRWVSADDELYEVHV